MYRGPAAKGIGKFPGRRFSQSEHGYVCGCGTSCQPEPKKARLPSSADDPVPVNRALPTAKSTGLQTAQQLLRLTDVSLISLMNFLPPTGRGGVDLPLRASSITQTGYLRREVPGKGLEGGHGYRGLPVA